jgi:hypothetical protein
LSEGQRTALARERAIDGEQPEVAEVVLLLEGALDAALDQLRSTKEGEVLAPREVGRARAPSTVLGLLFHGAEHSARHAGQIVTLVRVTDRD